MATAGEAAGLTPPRLGARIPLGKRLAAGATLILKNVSRCAQKQNWLFVTAHHLSQSGADTICHPGRTRHHRKDPSASSVHGQVLYIMSCVLPCTMSVDRRATASHDQLIRTRRSCPADTTAVRMTGAKLQALPQQTFLELTNVIFVSHECRWKGTYCHPWQCIGAPNYQRQYQLVDTAARR